MLAWIRRGSPIRASAITVIVSAIIVSGQSVRVSTRSNISCLVQPDSPISVDRISLRAEGRLSALLANRSDTRIVRVQCGKFVLWPDKNVVTKLGRPFEVNLEAKRITRVEDLHVAGEPQANALQVMVFVVSVKYSSGGTWSEAVAPLRDAVVKNFGYRIHPAK